MTGQLAIFGLTPRFDALYQEVATDTSKLARVIRQDRGHAVVLTDDGNISTVPIRVQRTGAVVAGDWVSLDDDVVSIVLDRTSLLRRGVASRDDPEEVYEQPLVANAELVFIVCGADRPRSAGRIERAVAQTWDANATPVLIITKADIADDIDEIEDELRSNVPMIDVISVSALTGANINALKNLTADKTSVMLGESGAGKSTLLNALLGTDTGAVGDVRQADGRGRHTTTRRELHVLPGGGVLIDTPGVRSLGLLADTDSVDATFADISDLAVQCRFSDCAHDREPGCAVRAAVDGGTITELRFESWQTLRSEAEAAELRKDEAAKRKADRKFGRLVNEAIDLKGSKNRNRK